MNPNQNNRWAPVNPISNNARWEPHKQNVAIDPNNPPAIEGYFTAFTQRDGGQNGPFMVTTITMVNPDGSIGDDVDVAGGISLENSMRETPMNVYVRIEYHGKKASKGGRTFNDFRVFKDEAAPRYDQRADVMASAGQKFPAPAPVQRQAPAPAVQQPVFNQQPPQQFNQQQPGLQQNTAFSQQGPAYQQQALTGNLNAVPPVPQQQSFQAPPVQQRPFTPPPVPQQQQTFQAPPAHSMPPPNPQNGMFGGQQVSDPFGAKDDLPF